MGSLAWRDLGREWRAGSVKVLRVYTYGQIGYIGHLRDQWGWYRTNFPTLADEKRLNYLHLMNKAAKSEDRQSYFHYLKQAEKALKEMGKTNA